MSSSRTSRPAPPRGSARSGRAASPLPAPDRVQRVGLRLLRPVRGEEGLRPAGAERSRPALAHRHARRSRRRSASPSPTSPPACTRYSGILTALLRQTSTGRRRGGRRVAVRRARRVDGRAGLLHGLRRHGAAATGRASRVDRAVRPVRDVTTVRRSTSAIQNAREWARFCERGAAAAGAGRRRAVSRRTPPRVRESSRARRGDRRVFARADRRTKLHRRLDAAGIANARMNSIDEFRRASAAACARSLARHRLAGRPAARAACRRCAMADVEPVMGAVPALGQHTEPILEELGFDAERHRGVAPGED